MTVPVAPPDPGVSAPDESAPEGERTTTVSFLRRLEVDPRLFGMIVALVVIWVVLHVLTGGTFLTPRNLWNLSVQTSVVGIMATGMVLVIVSRNIDLSVGSMLAAIGMAMAILQVEWLPQWLGLENSWTWIIALLAGVAMGALIGGFQGSIVAYVGVPAFIVTLGGLLVWRGVAWAMASGRTIAPMDSNFSRLGGGGIDGSIGGTLTWVLAGVACVGIVVLLLSGRRRKQKYGFSQRPVWADVLLGVLECGAVLGVAYVINSYFMPPPLAREYVESQGEEYTPGMEIPFGLPIPVVIMLGVGLLMTFLATRTRFGRYVFAIGGNPEAAELGGVKSKWMIVQTFALMGMLVAIASAVQIARTDAATSGLGTLAELYTIAAAVIGGTSLAGGIGTIPGALLGALVAQSLQSGMVLLNIDAPLQQIVVGIVLVVAVALDSFYRRRVG
jgi:D-xylose transport system permease protein